MDETEISELYNFNYNCVYNNIKNDEEKKNQSPYDIVYFCGGFGKKWNPTDDALDDPEKDLVWLCEIAATTGRKIAVYANIFENITYNNVDYKKWNLFEFNHQYNTVILWRSYGLICGLPYALKSKFTLFNVVYEDFTNTNANMYKVYNKYENKISRILFNTNEDKEEFERFLGEKINIDYQICNK
jgi:hypothetical protein